MNINIDSFYEMVEQVKISNTIEKYRIRWNYVDGTFRLCPSAEAYFEGNEYLATYTGKSLKYTCDGMDEEGIIDFLALRSELEALYSQDESIPSELMGEF